MAFQMSYTCNILPLRGRPENREHSLQIKEIIPVPVPSTFTLSRWTGPCLNRAVYSWYPSWTGTNLGVDGDLDPGELVVVVVA